MIDWRWCRAGQAEAVNQSSPHSNVILTGVRAKRGSVVVGHQIVNLGDPPGETLGNNHVHATASRHSKCILAGITGYRVAAVRTANQKLCKRNEVVESPPIYPRTKQVGGLPALDRLTAHVAAKVVLSELTRQPENVTHIVSKSTGCSVVVKATKWAARIETHIAVASVEFVLWKQTPRRSGIFRLLGRRLRARERSCLRNCRNRKHSTSGGSDAHWSCWSIRRCHRVNHGFRRAVILLLCESRKCG